MLTAPINFEDMLINTIGEHIYIWDTRGNISVLTL